MIEKEASTITDDQWERINREFDKLRENEVKVAHEKAVQRVVQKAVDKATKETEERVWAEEQLKLVEAEQKSKEEGIHEGATQEKFKIACNLKLNGADDEFISKTTGLSLEEVKSLVLNK